ncbi:hypothetical protein AF335_20950 [Streptomyces eurocidicus]|uniref:Uncharacterized protein n=1 Tax=Streptomyces eurocidicus TaxID=66423 RepID=A0A2N8NTT8_STREU|nr:hypothetical protein [Streptomyces eurocidicus]MBB5119349.1 hypothetical protein [Streptomyces eurocidicus]MBF6053071.1 hypothetical protein [Streptomyces eurocidicus]PNE32189.1 hypothetical protein AF335_20950 [Streptomyces eurocidicus]
MSHPEYALDPDPSLNVQFVDSLVPTLTAGRYTLTAHQTLTKGGDRVDTDNYLDAPATQEVEVRAPRFTVQPEWIHGAYPTPGAGGLYDDVLPHVTLDRATLPWEREAKAHDGTRLPWLALLVFAEGELPGTDPHCLGRTDAKTVADLTGSESGVVLPPFDRDADPVTDDDKQQVCRTVLVPRSVFRAVAPTQEELPFLTHVRRVDERHQRMAPGDDLIQVGDYAVVVGNRLPSAKGGRYVAHLVSLEGWLSYLPGGADEAKDPGQAVRLISLWSWAFETIPDHFPGFAALTGHFVDTEGADGSDLLLRVPLPDRPLSGKDQQEVADRLGRGYLPVSCRTESGRSTFGWYRGPFTAQYVTPETDRARRRCAAEALIHLDRYGVFDVSLATAFTAGRGVALADHQFGAALLRLRGKVQRAAEKKSRTTATTGARARVEHLVANGLAGHLGEVLTTPARTRQAVDAPARRPGVTPVPAATELPATAGLGPERLRTDAALRARLTSDDKPLVDPDDDDLVLVRNRLLGLRNLTGVPFAHLVPDSRMLPAESLRFFYVDADWTAMLLDGALSVGLAHTFDLTSDDLVFGPTGVAPLPPLAAPVTGLLLRSELVSGWPALEVRPYANPQAAEGEPTLPVLRREALADDVLLVLVEGVPGRVELAEPQQGVHFGIDEPEEGGSDDPIVDGIIRLRALSGDAIGKELDPRQYPFPVAPDKLSDYLRTPADAVLNVKKLADGLGNALKIKDRPLTPSEFAIQMINAAQRRTFTTASTAHTPFTTGDHPNG